jgi:transcription elongation factor/antiterminator RfaH
VRYVGLFETDQVVRTRKRAVTLIDKERWFLVHTLARGETRAQVHLRAQGFKTYFPQVLKTIRHARKFRTVQAPLFPRYIFIALDLERDRWLSVGNTIGVSSLFSCAGRPVPVPAGIVERLIVYDETANLALLDNNLIEGQPVRILSGPFADLIGTLARLDGGGRVRVLLKIMGNAVPVALKRSALSPAA